MSATVKQSGFSLPEVLVAMMLLVMVVTALGGYHRALAGGFASWSQYRALWRHAWQQAQIAPPPLPPGWQVQKRQTSVERCVSISASIISPSGREGQITRLFCPQDR